MLRKFTVKNFKNFRETLCLDFTKVRDYHYNEYCVKNNLINKVIIYGKNAVGKSNLGTALFDLAGDIFYTKNPYLYRGDRRLYKNANAPEQESAEFAYSFQFGSVIVDYIYKKKDVSDVVSEKLAIDSKTVFYYDLETNEADFSNVSAIHAGDLNWSEFLDAMRNPEQKDIESTQPTALRYIIYNTVQTEQSVISQLTAFIKGMRFTHSATSFPLSLDISDHFENEESLAKFERFLNDFGVPCKLILVERFDGKKEVCFDYAKPLPFGSNLSSGTVALTRFYLQYVGRKKPTFIYMDEFDAYYHYELSEKIVELLEKAFDCQVILTTHNTNLLSNSVMRPDCFMILAGGKLTPICEATNRELRQGHNLEKLYLNGEFDG